MKRCPVERLRSSAGPRVRCVARTRLATIDDIRDSTRVESGCHGGWVTLIPSLSLSLRLPACSARLHRGLQDGEGTLARAVFRIQVFCKMLIRRMVCDGRSIILFHSRQSRAVNVLLPSLFIFVLFLSFTLGLVEITWGLLFGGLAEHDLMLRVRLPAMMISCRRSCGRALVVARALCRRDAGVGGKSVLLPWRLPAFSVCRTISMSLNICQVQLL
ncbi:hypothetical protein C8R45DRAFT_1004286 [Mycena sanguinolenta]|nr:hypothetical protein C8R45DRAFT_1004286 [Mycena sanguinolenta]